MTDGNLWVGVYHIFGFSPHAIEALTEVTLKEPDHEEDPIYVDGVRIPRGLEWEVETEAEGHKLANAINEAYRLDAFVQGMEDCETGMHSWVHHVGKLPPETQCRRCGEEYGDPS